MIDYYYTISAPTPVAEITTTITSTSSTTYSPSTTKESTVAKMEDVTKELAEEMGIPTWGLVAIIIGNHLQNMKIQ